MRPLVVSSMEPAGTWVVVRVKAEDPRERAFEHSYRKSDEVMTCHYNRRGPQLGRTIVKGRKTIHS